MERVLYMAHPLMFRNQPILFLLGVAAIALWGLGLVFLLIWWLQTLGTTLTVTDRRTVLRANSSGDTILNFSTALNTARTGSISAFQLDQQFGSFGFGSGLSHDFAPVHRLALAFGHACRTIR